LHDPQVASNPAEWSKSFGIRAWRQLSVLR
jgi:hypothetical protein